MPVAAGARRAATAAALGFTVKPIPANENGRVDLVALKAALGPDVAAIMLTNPNTCGLFESEIVEISKAVHAAGAYFYCDGANFNAIVGRVRPGDLGVDCMHINLHKTFSTPHGGGGPGAGPVVLSAALAPYAPYPWIVKNGETWTVAEDGARVDGAPIGRLKAFHGQMGMFTRALAYILSHGADGLKQASEDAVLSANYVMASLNDVMTPAFDGPCMHECLFDDSFLKDTGVSTLDFAKAMIDEGYHPMTMYFPLVVHGALLIEPTESQAKEDIDQFVAALRSLADGVRGPLIATALNEVGWVSLFMAVFNVLPGLPLDGGRMLMIVLRSLVGSRLSVRVERLTYLVGFVFLFAFLPAALVGTWSLRNKNLRLGFITLASWVFYAWWDWRFLPLMLGTTTVDYIAALGVISWLHDPDQALREIRRILKPGGFALITVNNLYRLSHLVDPFQFPPFAPLKRGLKAALEGGIEGRPANVLFYATSNRRHMMPRDMMENERSTAINPSEAVEEKVSLSDRFGLWLGFHNGTQDQYFDMVRSYAAIPRSGRGGRALAALLARSAYCEKFFTKDAASEFAFWS